MYTDKIILITGGSGFLGSRIIQELLTNHKPRKVICFSRRWNAQKQLAASLNYDGRLRTIAGDVCDYPAIKSALRDVNFVFHAAAFKDAPSAEYSPFECVRVNVHGSENLIRASIDADVERVLVISSDKACDPLNLYGASKRAMESLAIAANSMGNTEFIVARYGNVFNSTGSVVSRFLSQAKNGNNLSITDPNATRFWITEQKAIELVFNAMTYLQPGEIAVPNLKSSTVLQLAEAFKEIFPYLKWRITGERPGDKQHEAMISIYELNRVYILTPLFYIIAPQFNNWDSTQGLSSNKRARFKEAYTSALANKYTQNELVAMIRDIM